MTLSRRVLLLWVEFHCQKCPAFSLKTATLKSIMAKNLFFLVLFSLFLASNGETFSSIKGYYLPGYELGEIFTSDWFECINKCNPNADCISYNFNLRESLCQLNTRGIDHLTYVADRTLNHNDDYIFHQLKVSHKKIQFLKELVLRAKILISISRKKIICSCIRLDVKRL